MTPFQLGFYRVPETLERSPAAESLLNHVRLRGDANVAQRCGGTQNNHIMRTMKTSTGFEPVHLPAEKLLLQSDLI